MEYFGPIIQRALRDERLNVQQFASLGRGASQY
jgi:hypothetical protein